MYFYSNQIITVNKSSRTKGKSLGRRAVITGCLGGKGSIRSTGSKIVAIDFSPVYINSDAIISFYTPGNGSKTGRIGNGNSFSKVGSYVFSIGIGAIAHHRCFIAIAISQLRVSADPRPIIKR